jgi:mono/diheme cytochrome c family protein
MRALALTFATVAVAGALSVPAQAKPAYVKKAQDAGHKELVVNCQSCHKAKLPTKKDNAFNDSLGAFLDKKMKETKAKEMDFKWLKDYKPPTK